MKKVQLQCSVNEFKEGMESTFWKDISNQLDAWKEDIRDALEDPDSVLSDKQEHVLQGNAAAVRNVMALPEQTLKNLEDKVTEI